MLPLYAGGREFIEMEDYKRKYIRLIESYLEDREGSKKHIGEAIRVLVKGREEIPENVDTVVLRRNFEASLFPGGMVGKPSDPVFSAVMDLDQVSAQIQEEVEKRNDLINCFALILVLYQKIDTSFLLLDLRTRQMISRVYFDKTKSYLLKREFCFGQEKIDRMIREGIESIYESVRSAIYDHAVDTVQQG